MNGWMDKVNSLVVEEFTMYYDNAIAVYENEMIISILIRNYMYLKSPLWENVFWHFIIQVKCSIKQYGKNLNKDSFIHEIKSLTQIWLI